MSQETNQEVKKVHVIFRDEEIDIYSEAQHHAIDAGISGTEYIKQALIEKNLKSRITKIAQSK
jgi:hypothetical protein